MPVLQQKRSIRTRMRTSPFLGGSTTTVVTSRGLLASQATAARHSMGCAPTNMMSHSARQDSRTVACLCAQAYACAAYQSAPAMCSTTHSLVYLKQTRGAYDLQTTHLGLCPRHTFDCDTAPVVRHDERLSCWLVRGPPPQVSPAPGPWVGSCLTIFRSSCRCTLARPAPRAAHLGAWGCSSAAPAWG